jgi:hypothetical protein
MILKMSEKKPHNFKRPFNDSNLPINDLSVERTEEIEKLVIPRLTEAFKKLRQEKPHLFKSSSK